MSEALLRRHNVTCMGEGEQVLVLAHGFGCDQQVWRHVAEDLARDHRIVLFDHMGSGRSDTSVWRADRYTSLHAYARDVLDILGAMHLQRVNFVGHSVSGSIGLLAAIEQPECFERLVMVGPNPCFVNDPPHYMGGFERADIMDLLDLMDRNMIGWANFFAPVAMKNPDRPELSQDLLQNLCAGDPVILRHFAQIVFLSDVRADLLRLTVPTLIMQCADDAVAPDTVGAYMKAHMPHALLWHMQATGHCPHMSQPSETIDMLRRYMALSPT